MDINLSYSISNEDLIGVLRTIWLFLESINFSATSVAFQDECSSKGYRDIATVPAKVVVVTPTAINESYNSRIAHQSTQTNHSLQKISNSDKPGQNLPSPIKIETIEPLYVYYTDADNFSNNFLNDTEVDECISDHKTPTKEQNTVKEYECGQYITEQFYEESADEPSLSPGVKDKKSNFKRSPNTIESEIPTKISSKSSVKNHSRENLKQGLRKSCSNPNLKANKAKSTNVKSDKKANLLKSSVPNNNCEQDIEKIDDGELRKRFCELLKEHKKLMGVASELTAALQTHIRGQSENLNAVLNNCKNIYPDLFKSGSLNNKQTSLEDAVPDSYNNADEIISLKVISKNNAQTGSTHISSEIVTKREIRNSNGRLISSAPDSKSSGSDTSKEISNPNMKKHSSSIQDPTNSKNPSDISLENVSEQNIQQRVLSAESLTAKSAVQTSADIITSQNNCMDKNVSEKISGSVTSVEDISEDSNSVTGNASTEILVEVKNIIKDLPISSTSNIKRPRSSSVVLVTTSRENMHKPKVLLRQCSSKSCDESWLASPSRDKSLTKVTFQRQSNAATNNDLDKHERPQTVNKFTSTEDDNYQQTSDETNNAYIVNYLTSSELPEIYITTENMAKVKRNGANPSSETSGSNYSSPRNQYFELDFRKLKKDLLHEDDDLKLALIQALRWRLTQSDAETRDQIISSYIRHDLLGLHCSPLPCGQSTLELFYTPNKETPHLLQEGIARLVNTFASLTLGREYLCQDDDLLVSLLVPLITGTHYSKVKINDITLDMLMATLQKMSLRNRQRLRMISAGLVEFLVTFLATKHTIISAYCMEYATALFMNLCLHHEARERLHPIANDIVKLLVSLLNTKHQYCLPYINGAMYSLLGDAYINQEAQACHFSKAIEASIERADGEMKRQLKFILKLHLMGTDQNDCDCDANIEPENEVDLLEPELDSDDSYSKQPAGEKVLKDYKLLFPIYGSQVYATHLKCFCRPLTPIPRHTQQSTKSIDAVPDLNNAEKMQTQVVIQELPSKCKCLLDKIRGDSSDFNSNCTCDVVSSTNPNGRTAKGCTASKNSKRGGSEPSANLKNTENVKQGSISEKSSPRNSPKMSFCEDTQKFYHTPSGKTGIFESQKPKKLHRVPPSFTRTIPLPIRTEHSPSSCNNPFCSQPYTKTMPIIPKDNSSVTNPPFSVNYSNYSPMCYRQTYLNQGENRNNMNSDCDCYRCTNVCPNCSRRNKYACGCYNAIKGFVDETSQDNANNRGRIGNNSDNNNEIRTCQCNVKGFTTAHQSLCHNCQNSKTFAAQGPTVRNYEKSNYSSAAAKPTTSSTNTAVVNFSYAELVAAVKPGSRVHVCPNSEIDCRCYDEVFQSRPKILRTPP